jgi:hypothetical protein
MGLADRRRLEIRATRPAGMLLAKGGVGRVVLSGDGQAIRSRDRCLGAPGESHHLPHRRDVLHRRFAICMVLTVWYCISLTPAMCPATSVDLVPAVDTETWPDAPFRWKDIATNLYAEAYRDSYTYDEASVLVTFETAQDSLWSGHLSAVGLKPNFAFQIKLVGKPSGLWGIEGDDIANERIGYAGRWWRVTPSPGNSTDQDYEAHCDDPEYIYEGYLLFDFFASDSLGSAEADFATASSYHVLWWEGQRARGSCDSPVRYSTVVGHAADPAYDTEVGPSVVGVYAEIERLCEGETMLPGGAYDCRFFLTEESFHQSGEYDGYWLSVLTCDTLHFELLGPAGITAKDERQDAGSLQISPNPSRTSVVITFSLSREAQVDIAIYDTAGRLVTPLAKGDFTAGTHSLTWPRLGSSGGVFPAGVYFCRIQAGEERQTRKVVVTN